MNSTDANGALKPDAKGPPTTDGNPPRIGAHKPELLMKPDVSKPEPARLQIAKAEAAKPEASAPEAGKPEAEAAKPEEAKQEVAKPATARKQRFQRVAKFTYLDTLRPL